MASKHYAIYEPAKPYFDLVRAALGDLVDGTHFFDGTAEDVVYEVLYHLPGWPPVIEGRDNLMASFHGYCQHVKLHSADHLMKHVLESGNGIVIEYEVRGTILTNGAEYHNRFCSIIKVRDRKIIHWRDYMDSLAAWNALTGPAPSRRPTRSAG